MVRELTADEVKWARGEGTGVLTVMRRFPPGTRLGVNGKPEGYVVAYPELDLGQISVSLSQIDPNEDWDAAVADFKPVCPSCINDLEVME